MTSFNRSRPPSTKAVRWTMSASRTGGSEEKSALSSHEIRQLAGPVADHTVIAILETGASITDLEVAVMQARGEGEYDVTGHALSGKAALVSDILAKDDLYTSDEER
jgi:hypothetical protein